MSDINANIVIAPIDLNVTVNTNQLSFTPDAVSLNIYTATGLPTTPTSLNANIANVHIYDGVNGYVLQTDGTGNLSWTAQTGNGGGNGTPGGANTQVQYNDSGSFGGNAGFTFNEITGNLNVPNNVIATNFIGNIAVANTVSNSYQPNITNVGTLTQLTVAGSSNLGSNSNVIITGGSSGYALITDGAGNLSWSTVAQTGWSNVANILSGDIFFGIYAGSNTSINPGYTVSITSTLNSNSFSIANTGYANGVWNLGSTDNYIWALRTDSTSNIARSDSIGTSWSTVAVPFSNPSQPPLQAGNNIVIWKSGSNSSAYSSNNGTSWTVANNINTTLNLGQGAYGNGTIIITRSEFTSNNFIKSADYGLTWSNSNFGSSTNGSKAIAYGNSKFMTFINGSNVAKITTNNGNTWSNINVGNSYLWNSLAYGNGKWVGVSEYTGANTRGAAIVSSNDGSAWTTTLLANLVWNDITYTNGYFIAAELDGNVITSVDGITWTTANTALGSSNGGSVAYNNTDNLLIVGSRGPTGSSNVAVALTPKIAISSADGNLSNSSTVPLGTYKNLGGAVGNVGAMWTRTA